MPLPAITATSDYLVRDGLYIHARLAADADTQALTSTLDAQQKKLEDSVANRRLADRTAIEAAAMADHRLTMLQRAIVAFGVKVYGHYGARTDAQYVRIFPIAPSLLAACNPSDRMASFAALRNEAVDAETSIDLAPAVKLVVAAIDAWRAAVDAAEKVDDQLASAVRAEAAAADGWQTAVR